MKQERPIAPSWGPQGSPGLPALTDNTRYALEQAKFLLHLKISGWPRRGHSLLMAGSGDGLALEQIWNAGFDVTGVDSDPTRLDLAAARLGHRADLRRGSPAHIPFDDDFFDYAAVIDLPGFSPAATPFVDRALEACRCAQRGVVFGFLNVLSLHGLALRLRRLPLHTGQDGESPVPQSWSALLRKLRNAGFSGRVTSASILLGPAGTWRPGGIPRLLNSRSSRLPLGAFMVARMDFTPAPTLTPLTASAQQTATAGAQSGASGAMGGMGRAARGTSQPRDTQPARCSDVNSKIGDGTPAPSAPDKGRV